MIYAAQIKLINVKIVQSTVLMIPNQVKYLAQCPQLRSELDRLGPNSDFFEQSGPKKVRIDPQKSELVDENTA